MVMAAESPAAMVELESVENWEQCEIVLFLCLRDVCVKRKGLKCGGLKREMNRDHNFFVMCGICFFRWFFYVGPL